MTDKQNAWSTLNRRNRWIFWLGIFLVSVLVGWLNSVTVSQDLTRNDIAFKSWHPYVWEYSSFLSAFVLYFAVFKWVQKWPLLSENWRKNWLIHLALSLLFSVLHVGMMVWLRILIYRMAGDQYDFGDWLGEWVYEYRKDVITYFVFALLLNAWAYFLAVGAQKQSAKTTKKIQIKHKGQVRWLNPADIVTVESGGNYVYFHANEQVLPMRATMAEAEKMLDSDLFIRAHRSYIVNIKYIQSFQKPSQDTGELLLKHGKVVPVSNKYRAFLLQQLSQRLTPVVVK